MDMRKLAFIFLLVLDFGACTNQDDEINIRLRNSSTVAFTDIIVNTSSGDNTVFENLESDQVSAYQSFEIAYRYAFIELTANEQTLTIQPIDYVGETPLKGGLYTYELDIVSLEDRYGGLVLKLIED